MIRIFKAPRQAGKTHRTVSWWAREPYTRMIVTFSEREAQNLREMAKSLKGKEWAEQAYPALHRNIVPWRNLHRDLGRSSKTVRIDNADIILRDLIGAHNNLEEVTWNGAE